MRTSFGIDDVLQVLPCCDVQPIARMIVGAPRTPPHITIFFFQYRFDNPTGTALFLGFLSFALIVKALRIV